MEPSPAPLESPAKAADKETNHGSLSRFKALTAKLFALDRAKFQGALKKDEEERREKRGR